MKSVMIVSGLLAVAGTAMGQSVSAFTPNTEREFSVAGPTGGSSELSGGSIQFDVTGIGSGDSFGSPINRVYLVDVAAALGYASGTPITMNGIGWNVNLTANGASWRSELGVAFDDPATPGTAIALRPGAGTNSPGGPTNFTSPIIKFASVPLPDILLPNGILRMEFYESYDDVVGADDGIWNSGFLTIQTAQANVPAPGVAGVFGLAGLAAARRRRA